MKLGDNLIGSIPQTDVKPDAAAPHRQIRGTADAGCSGVTGTQDAPVWQ
jgi:hypothetical protein